MPNAKSSARITFNLTLTGLFQELGEGGGGEEVVGLVRIAKRVLQGFICLKLNYLSSGRVNSGSARRVRGLCVVLRQTSPEDRKAC